MQFCTVLVSSEPADDLEIESLEAGPKALEEKMSAGDYYKLGAEEVNKDRNRAEEIEGELMGKLERWEELEGKAKALTV